MNAIMLMCAFLCVAFSLIGCMTKIEVAEKYDKMYAQVLFGEMRSGNISEQTYEKLLKECDIERYRVDEIEDKVIIHDRSEFA